MSATQDCGRRHADQPESLKLICRRIKMQRVGPRKTSSNQQINLPSAELWPVVITNATHFSIKHQNFTQTVPPWRTEMVATTAGIVIEQNTDVWIVCYAQTLNVNTRTLVFRNDGIILQGLFEDMPVVIRPANKCHAICSTQIIAPYQK